MPPCLPTFRIRFLPGRRVLCVVLAVHYIAIASGIPIPIGRPLGKIGGLFPCSTCGCGCATAEQCWQSCCCHTLAERMEWARKHGVRPPEQAIAEARAAGHDLAWLGIKSLPSCCNSVAEKPLPPCCQNRAASNCCNSAAGRCERSGRSEHSSESGPDHVVVWRALACHGQSPDWLAATPALIPKRPTISHVSPLVAWLGPAKSESAGPHFRSPEVPPPEIA